MRLETTFTVALPFALTLMFAGCSKVPPAEDTAGEPLMAAAAEHPTAYWTTSLSSSDPTARRAAARGLSLSGEESRSALPVLVAALGDPDFLVRVEVVTALARTGRGEPTVADALASAFRDTEPAVRVAAARGLSSLVEPDGSGLLSAPARLFDSPEDGDEESRAAWDSSLSAALSALAGSLDDPDEKVRRAALAALDEISKRAPARLDSAGVATLLGAAVTGSEDGAANAATRVLRALSPESREPAAAALRQQLSSTESPRRRRAVEALASLGSPPAEDVPSLTGLLSDESREVRQAAAEALARAGEPGTEALGQLIRDSTTPLDVLFALDALGRAAEPEAALAVVVAASRSLDADLRAAAARALGNQRFAAKDTASALLELLRDGDPRVRAAAIPSIVRQRQIVPRALELVQGISESDPDPKVRSAASNGLMLVQREAIVLSTRLD